MAGDCPAESCGVTGAVGVWLAVYSTRVTWLAGQREVVRGKGHSVACTKWNSCQSQREGGVLYYTCWITSSLSLSIICIYEYKKKCLSNEWNKNDYMKFWLYIFLPETQETNGIWHLLVQYLLWIFKIIFRLWQSLSPFTFIAWKIKFHSSKKRKRKKTILGELLF